MTTSFLEDELIFYKENDQIKSGGYSVKSALLNNNISPMTTMNTFILGGGEKVSESFENLAVPAGLFFINQKIPKIQQQQEKWEPHKVISDDLYDKLFDLIRFDNKNNNKKRKTKKRLSISKNKKTRKNEE